MRNGHRKRLANVMVGRYREAEEAITLEPRHRVASVWKASTVSFMTCPVPKNDPRDGATRGPRRPGRGMAGWAGTSFPSLLAHDTWRSVRALPRSAEGESVAVGNYCLLMRE